MRGRFNASNLLGTLAVLLASGVSLRESVAALGLIIDDILAGMENKAEIELDRRRAIKNAISRARYGDVVLIAGKGHETYQEEKGMRYAFSDLGVARELLGGAT